jgi:hypothetical protein
MKISNNPKPNKSIFELRKSLEQKLNTEWNEELAEQHLNILNDYNWSTEIFKEGDKYGLKMWDDTILLPAVFDNFMTLTSEELSFGDKVVANLNGKEGVVLPEESGWKWILEPEFDYISYPNDIVAVQKGELWGVYCFSQAKYLIPIACEIIPLHNGFLFMNGIGLYKKDGRWGILNDAGEYTEALFDEVEEDIEGPVKVKLGEQWGFVKESGIFGKEEDDAYFWFTM